MEKESKKIEIIPAIMPEDIQDIYEGVQFVKHSVDTVQLDLMDGKYVPPRTLPFRRGRKIDTRFMEELREQGLPFWEEINYELDLMVMRPEEILNIWRDFSPARIIFHYASVHDWAKIFSYIDEMGDFIEFGMAVTVFDDLKEVGEILKEKKFSFVQCMGIEHIGYMGQEFTDSVFQVIGHVRDFDPSLVISVDGGVSEMTIRELAREGVSRFVSGSAIYHHGIPEENVRRLQELAEEGLQEKNKS